MSTVENKLTELGLTLPTPVAPVANYVPFTIFGKLLVISGQLALDGEGKLAEAHKGKVGAAVSPEAAKDAAKLAALNVLAQAKLAVGDLDRIQRCIRLGGFINADPNFAAIPAVMNGASDLMVAALGERGRHARTTIGVAVLPFDCVVEVEAMFEIAE